MTNTTLKKISVMLGLSISTVSRALKNHPDISDKTKQRVNELANALDYEPNANAIHLRTSKNNVFGLIVPTVANFFYDSFIAAIEEEARKTNYSLLILQSGDDAAIEADNIRICRQNRISGLFACMAANTSNLEPFLKLKAQEIPVIFFDKVPDNPDCIKVCVADALSATIAANTITEKKKKKILGVFGNPNLSITKKRLDAFRLALPAKTSLQVLYAANSAEATALVSEALETRPDTVFCMSDEVLTGSMKAIQRAGLQVPKDVSVISISNGFIPTLYHPEITYVETSGYKLGRLAFSSMIASMGGGQFSQELTIESLLVKGGSI